MKFERSGVLDDALVLDECDELLRQSASSVPKPAAKAMMVNMATMQIAISSHLGRRMCPLWISLSSSLVKYDGGCDVRAAVEDLGSGVSARTFSL